MRSCPNILNVRKTFMGVMLGSAVAPIALAITWHKANKWGCIGGAIAGLFAGLIAWLVTTATLNDGIITVVVSTAYGWSLNCY